MSFNIAARSFTSKPALIPVEQLLGACSGSRMPEVEPERLTVAAATEATQACPTSALQLAQVDERAQLVLDYGECTGCGSCRQLASGLFRLAENFPYCGVSRRGLVRRWDIAACTELPAENADENAIATAAAASIRALLGRALNIREVDAGSCNGCEAEIGALTGPHYDLERFGIHFVASPKHADMLLVTGPVTLNMTEALRRTYEATPSPKLVLAIGTCGCSGGIFAGSPAITGAVDVVIPVDGFVPGCPPTPAMLLTGILRVLDSRSRL